VKTKTVAFTLGVNDHLIGNYFGAGFFRVMYDDVLFGRVKTAIAGGSVREGAIATIISDSFALMDAGLTGPQRALDVTK
jgi:hypothetical protein